MIKIKTIKKNDNKEENKKESLDKKEENKTNHKENTEVTRVDKDKYMKDINEQNSKKNKKQRQ